jgi:hypothetical protein
MVSWGQTEGWESQSAVLDYVNCYLSTSQHPFNTHTTRTNNNKIETHWRWLPIISFDVKEVTSLAAIHRELVTITTNSTTYIIGRRQSHILSIQKHHCQSHIIQVARAPSSVHWHGWTMSIDSRVQNSNRRDSNRQDLAQFYSNLCWISMHHGLKCTQNMAHAYWTRQARINPFWIQQCLPYLTKSGPCSYKSLIILLLPSSHCFWVCLNRHKKIKLG